MARERPKTKQLQSMRLSHCKSKFHQKMIAFHSKSKEIQVIAHSMLQGIAISKMNVKTQWKQQIPKGAKRPWGAAEGGAFVVFIVFSNHFWNCIALQFCCVLGLGLSWISCKKPAISYENNNRWALQSSAVPVLKATNAKKLELTIFGSLQGHHLNCEPSHGL